MADYGMVIYNNNSEVVIDSQNQNLHIDKKGSLTTSNFNVSLSFGKAYNSPPLVAVNSTGASIWMARYELDASDRFTGALFQSEVSSASFNYCVASPRDAVVGDDYGLQIFNAGGELVFDSGAELLIIKDVISFAHPLPDIADMVHSRQTMSKSHNSVSDPYYIVSNDLISAYSQSWDGTDIMLPQQLGYKKNSSTEVEVGYDQPDAWSGLVLGYEVTSGDSLLLSNVNLIVCRIA